MEYLSSDDDSVLSFDDIRANDVEDNPWNVTHLNEFCFFLCPECDFKEKNQILFRNHAIETHRKARLILKASKRLQYSDFSPVNPTMGWSYNWEGEMDDESDIGESETTAKDWENEEIIEHEKEKVKICHDPNQIKVPANAKIVKVTKGNDGSLTCQFCTKAFVELEEVVKHMKFCNKHRVTNLKFHCVHCNLRLDSQENLLKHQITKECTKKKQLRVICHICAKLYRQFELEKHVFYDHGEHSNTDYQCEICREYLFDETDLLAHKEDVHGGERICEHCGEKFDMPSLLKKHCQEKHPAIPKIQYICKICNHENSRGPKDLQYHMIQKHPDPARLLCQICDCLYENLNELYLHFRDEHPKKPSPLTEEEIKFLIHECNICQKVVASRTALYTHLKLTHKVKQEKSHGNYSLIKDQKCDFCDVILKTDVDYVDHMVVEHPRSKLPAFFYTKRYYFRCLDCKDQFGVLWKYYVHRGGLSNANHPNPKNRDKLRFCPAKNRLDK